GWGDHHRSTPAGREGGFVEETGQFGAAEAGSHPGGFGQVDLGTDFHGSAVDVKTRLTSLHVGESDREGAVETPGSEEGFVESVFPVGGRDDDHALASARAIHFHQESVQRLVVFAGCSLTAIGSAAADGVDLVDKNDAWRLFA